MPERYPQRLALYVDGAFRQDPGGTDVYSGTELFGFMRFACAVGAGFERFAILARAAPKPLPAEHRLPPGVTLLALPYYSSLRELGRLIASVPATLRVMWRALDELDIVWVSGVHPLGLALAVLARLRGRRVVLLIRQDSPRYFRSRLPSSIWAPLLLPLRGLDGLFRMLARRLPTTVVGAAIGRQYRAPRENVLEMRVTLLERPQLAPPDGESKWGGVIELLTVGRIDPEKNPLLAAELLALLARKGPSCSLTWIGEGSLAAELAARAADLGVGERLLLPGYVPFGEELLARYRAADAFVHIAATEGAPGVLWEAMGQRTPVIGTDVGGVRELLEGGEAGLLVPPGDAEALAAAVRRLAADPSLRRRLVGRGAELAAAHTLEAESARVAAFIGDASASA